MPQLIFFSSMSELFSSSDKWRNH